MLQNKQNFKNKQNFINTNYSNNEIKFTNNNFCFILQPDFSKIKYIKINKQHTYCRNTLELQFHEINNLAKSLKLKIFDTYIIKINKFIQSTIFSKSKIKTINEILILYKIKLVIINTILTPIQQRNLEQIWNIKILDRTGLILKIFNDRAKTKESKLQVNLANLNYQRSRLVKNWTHLERQRGKTNFISGPGEKQIESDKRIIQIKISKIKKQLIQVKKTRNLQRITRKKTFIPIVAIVGYTNAGKSTLFKLLSKENVSIKDMLFTTLDPTIRKITLSTNFQIIISDTVGFISNLPHDLIDAFSSTLEEILEADLILHVEDISSIDYDSKELIVNKILTNLGIGDKYLIPIIRVWNKIDLLSKDKLKNIQNIANKNNNIYTISSLNSTGLHTLSKGIEKNIQIKHFYYKIILSSLNTSKLTWIYKYCKIKKRNNIKNNLIKLTITVNIKYNKQFKIKFIDELNSN